MSTATSPATGKTYSISTICRVWKVPRSSVYAARQHRADSSEARRRGPPPAVPEDVLKEEIRGVLSASSFHSEGYRKVWARLRLKGIRTSKDRVRRLMREEGLSAPHFPTRTHGNKAHDGRITTDVPDEMWGTDATSTMTRQGSATIFIAVDHCTAECVGIHAARKGDRFAALEPVLQGVRENFGLVDAGTADGLALRHDHGSQYTSHHFQDEMRFLGIRTSPSFVAEPECNGVAERFIRTLKEQLLWIESFDTVEELRLALLDFKDRYNNGWLVQKHGHITPNQARAKLKPLPAQAA